jgi:glucose/arabinose dehydrogenase
MEVTMNFRTMTFSAAILLASSSPALSEGAGIKVADGYSASIFADNLGRARHLVVRDNGDVYVAIRGDKGIIALRDTDADGKADVIEEFPSEAETEVEIYKGHLYFSSNTEIFRARLDDGALLPQGDIQSIISGFPTQRQHAAKTFTFDETGHIYVNVGAPSNACQIKSRSPGSLGQSPCPHLDLQAGVWRFDAETVGQTQIADGHRYVTGLRNAMAISWHPDGGLHLVQHGRDQLGTLWSDYYTNKDNAELPAEEFHAVDDGSNLGWPYTYYDPMTKKRMVGPEYGGDGKTADHSGKYQNPFHAFPGHWAPNDLIFYKSGAFSPTMKGGAFIAFHGSWNRAPEPQQGYKIVFVPFKVGEKNGAPKDFAWGFQGDKVLVGSERPDYRPIGLAEGPDGTLYVSDSMKGRIWKITKNEE